MRRLILALILCPGLALADSLPQPASDKVNDWAEVLSPAVEAQLATTLTDARRETGVHVVLVTMRDHADFGGAGESLESYATRLFNHWGIGDKARNDGVLILVTPGRRAMRIELGRGYGTDWDDTAKGIIDDTFLPAFREGQIEAGIRRGTDQVLTRIAQPFAKGERPQTGPTLTFWLISTFVIAIPVLAICIIFAFVFKDLFVRFTKCPQCGQRSLERESRTVVHPTQYSPGEGTRTTRCRQCSYVHTQSYYVSDTSSSDRSSSGGGGGFGGGSSSGGGGSGRW